MVPLGTSTFVFVVAKDPFGARNDFAANTLVFFIVEVLFDLFLRFSILIVPLLFPVLDILSGVLFLLVVKDDPLEAEGVEKSPFRQRSDVFWVDGSDLIGRISLQNDLCILWNISYL